MGSGWVDLFKKRQFLPLFLTQFFGAFNDNAFKLSMLTMISYHLSHSQTQSEYYQAMASALFMLPFFLVSATAGQLADKYDKALMTRLIKIFEVLLMIVGSLALYRGSILLMMLTLMGMGIHSTFFGPIKYAILPDHLPKQDLLCATGLIEGSTFLAILLGTTLGTLAVGSTGSKPYIAIFIVMGAAFAGLIASIFIPAAPSVLTDLKVDVNIGRATTKLLRQAKKEPGVLLCILTISWFWLIGAVMLTKLPDYTHYILGANTIVFAVFLALFSIGIALGSLMINRLLQGRVTLSVVPIALLALSGFTFDLYWVSPTGSELKPGLLSLFSFFTYFNHWRIAFDLFMLAFSAGLFVVPLYTYLQIISPPEARGRTIAANNICNSFFMVLGTLFVMLLLRLNIAIPRVFLIFSLLNMIVALGLWYCLRQKSRKAVGVI